MEEMQNEYEISKKVFCLFFPMNQIVMMKSVLLYLFLLIAATAGLLSCDITADVNADHDPVLQVDAVFFTGEQLPVIKVRQSFNTSGSSIFEIEEGDVLISGAQIELKHNGKPVPVTEESPGYYRPVSQEFVARGDHFGIVVTHNGKQGSATAKVPDYPTEEIQISPDDDIILSEGYLTEEVWTGDLQIDLEIPFLPAFTALRTYSEMEWELYEGNQIWLDSGGQLSFQSYLGEHYPGQTSLSFTRFATVFYSRKEGEEKPNGVDTITLYSEFIIPEPIYEAWHSTYTQDIVPLTITNVEGGVGLFIGAIRLHSEIDVEVELK